MYGLKGGEMAPSTATGLQATVMGAVPVINMRKCVVTLKLSCTTIIVLQAVPPAVISSILLRLATSQ